MPGPRSLLFSITLGLGVGLYLQLVVGLPTIIVIVVGATMTLVSLLIAASVTDHPEEADRAWHAAAPDLLSRHPGPLDGEPGTGPRPSRAAAPGRSADRSPPGEAP
jgi:hypothetical protein